jgi:hypothetical protein
VAAMVRKQSEGMHGEGLSPLPVLGRALFPFAPPAEPGTAGRHGWIQQACLANTQTVEAAGMIENIRVLERSCHRCGRALHVAQSRNAQLSQ